MDVDRMDVDRMDVDRMRVYLAGGVAIEAGETLVREDRFPGRQGRLAFAMLVVERSRPISLEQLADVLWGDDPPPARDTAIRAIVSKLRNLLRDVGVDGSKALAGAFGAYQLQLPPGTWVDLEAAADAIHRAETALRDGAYADAVGWNLVARSIASRSFLPGEEGDWVEAWRARLRDIRLRSFECAAQVWTASGDPSQGARDAEAAVGLDPLRESSHRHLMRALAASGDRAAALRAYGRCRATLAEELGVDPSGETQDLYLEILRSG